jgi:hypothetical protein
MATVQEEIRFIANELKNVQKAPEALCNLIDKLRSEMEVSSVSRGGAAAGGGARQFAITGGSSISWRNGAGSSSSKPFYSSHSHSGNGGGASVSGASVSGASGGRYVSRFVNTDSIEGKILNSVIGNKLNAFTPTTYKDTRDFIYQILDSGETEFIKDFVEKVFYKATCEDLYCSLFAQLIAEIAQKYPIIYDEMKKYHSEFMKVFDDAGDGDVKKKQHRLGYGQFISELAARNALDKEQLIEIMKKITEKIWSLSKSVDKQKVVEEFIDCIVRLTGSLKERSPRFFTSVSKDIQPVVREFVVPLIEKKAGDRPGLSEKARYVLMELRDLVF